MPTVRLAICVVAIWLIGGLAAVALRLGEASCVESPERSRTSAQPGGLDAPKPGGNRAKRPGGHGGPAAARPSLAA